MDRADAFAPCGTPSDLVDGRGELYERCGRRTWHAASKRCGSARWRARTRRVRAQPRTSRARYCCSRRRGEPLRYYGRASDYMPAGLLSDSLLYSNLHAPALCRKPRPGTSLITMVFVKYLYRYVRRQARIYSFRLNYTLLLLSGAHRRGQGLRERPGADAWRVHRQRQVYISVAR